MCFACTKCNKCGRFPDAAPKLPQKCIKCGTVRNGEAEEICSVCGYAFPMPPGSRQSKAGKA